MEAEFTPQELGQSIPLVSLEAIKLEEAVLGAILLDPDALAAIEGLTIQAFSISSRKQIFRVMQLPHYSSLKPDLATVAFRLSEKGILKHIGGKSKLASLLDRTVHLYSVKQHAKLLQEKYSRLLPQRQF
jgi:replicative DNA helicase